MQLLPSPFVAAVIQAAPVFMDRDATLDKVCELVLEAGQHGARLVAFPESFVPCYPDWVWKIPANEEVALNELYAEFLANAVTIPSDALDKVCRTARRAKTCVVLGVNERNAETSGASLYSSLVFIDAQGKFLGKHRKLVPTGGERLVWAQGDGSTLNVYNTPLGKLGGLIGSENYMPLALYTLYASGAQIFIAATRYCDPLWLATLRHLAKEGGMFVLSPCIAARTGDMPDNFAFMQWIPRSPDEWLHVGGSAIVNPKGEIVAGPVHKKQEILYTEIDIDQVRVSKGMLDVAGHDARPDVFQLRVHRQTREIVIQTDPMCSSQASDELSDVYHGI